MMINKIELQDMPSRKRATLVNSLAGFRQAFMIGTKSETGKTNLAVFNSLVHLGANPAYWAFVCRPNPEERDTYTNIRTSGFYTINYPDISQYQNVHQTSAKYAGDISEFDAAGFHEQYHDGFYAPFVKDSRIKFAFRYEDSIYIKQTKSTMVVGSLEFILLQDVTVCNDGFVNLSDNNILVCCGLDAYFKADLLGRMEYAEPDRSPAVLIR
jgi:flavin reductase (DIM6/NTAB) family NADH-FMN oxidoreductase RutF